VPAALAPALTDAAPPCAPALELPAASETLPAALAAESPEPTDTAPLPPMPAGPLRNVASPLAPPPLAPPPLALDITTDPLALASEGPL